MKLKSLLFALSMGFLSQSYAVQVHVNPQANSAENQSIAKEQSYPGYCQIELINDSPLDLWVHAAYDDGSYVDFTMYGFDAPHYISVYYYSYCHSGMYLSIQSAYGVIYSGWVKTDSSLHILSNVDKHVTVEKSMRK